MGKALPLDRLIGDTLPPLANDEDVRKIESVPWAQRVAAPSTYDALKLGAAIAPDHPAIRFLPNADPDEPAVVVSHRDFFARVTQAANMFAHLGVGSGDVVSFLLPLLPQAFYTLFGAEAAGIANPVNPLLEAHEIAGILKAARTKVLVTLGPVPGTDLWQKVESVRAQLDGVVAILQVGGAGNGSDGIWGFDALMARFPSDRLVSGRVIAAGDTAAYFHTGGTTGTPKLVRHTHANEVYQAWGLNLMLLSDPGSSLLFGLPLFHVGGALTQALATLTAGSSLVVVSPGGWRNPAAVRNIWRLIERFRAPVLSGVPTVLAAALGVPPGDADLSSLKVASGGGAAIPIAVGQALQERFGLPVVEVYGMTETASVLTLSYLQRPARLGSVGHPMPFSRVRAVKLDADGKYLGDCAPNEIGVISMSGPGVFSGYLNDEHNQAAFVEPGWVNSGDLGRVDEEGYVWITGRAKDLIIRGGHNIDPMEIEGILYRHPAVALAAMVGQPDGYAGETPVAYVQLKAGAQVTAGELLEWVRERTPERAAVPVAIQFVDEIPLTAVGKVFKPRLRWDAARSVFSQVLEPLAAQGIRLSVEVGAHGTHGSVATVTIAAVPAQDRDGIERQVRERLSPFVMRHEIRWA